MRLVFAGTPKFAVRALIRLAEAGHQIALVLTQPDRPSGRGMRTSECAVKLTARELGLDLFQPDTLRDNGTIEKIASTYADAIIVAAYGLLLPIQLLNTPRLGALNLHASLLPRWRGAAPVQRALLAGDPITGVTIMQMDAGLDSGAIVTQRGIPITELDDAGTLEEKLAELGALMIVDVLQNISLGKATSTAQPEEGATYARKIDKSETRLDWTRSAQELARAVRAYRPAPVSTILLGGELVKVWRAHPLTTERGAPGTLLRVDNEAIVVACGDGALALDELQRPGGKRLTARDFANGRRLRTGIQLSSAAA